MSYDGAMSYDGHSPPIPHRFCVLLFYLVRFEGFVVSMKRVSANADS